MFITEQCDCYKTIFSHLEKYDVHINKTKLFMWNVGVKELSPDGNVLFKKYNVYTYTFI